MLNVDTAGLEFLCSTVTPDLRMRLSAEFCRDDIIFEPSNIDVFFVSECPVLWRC